jgi:hypothetical protein
MPALVFMTALGQSTTAANTPSSDAARSGARMAVSLRFTASLGSRRGSGHAANTADGYPASRSRTGRSFGREASSPAACANSLSSACASNSASARSHASTAAAASLPPGASK